MNSSHDLKELFKKLSNVYMLFCQKWKLMNGRAEPGKMYIPTAYEHCANTVSHAVMIIPSILLSELFLWKTDKLCSKRATVINEAVLFTNSSQPTNAAYEFCSRAYGASLVCLFLFSSIFHWVCWTQSEWKKNIYAGCPTRRPSLNKMFHVCDRTTIFFFIAASYCPWLMLHPIDQRLLWLQWAVWIIAAAGTAYTFMFLEKFKLLEICFYLAVGIVPGLLMFLFNDIATLATPNVYYELGAGGAFYLIGVIFFKCDGFIPFAHAIWHTFVSAGAFSHTYLIYKNFFATLN